MNSITRLSPQQAQTFLAEHPQAILLDVRNHDEVALCSLPNHTHIPLHLIPLRHNELPDDCPIVIYCHHGMRSLQAALFLEHAGFTELYNLEGGIDAWSLQIDPSIPRY